MRRKDRAGTLAAKQMLLVYAGLPEPLEDSETRPRCLEYRQLVVLVARLRAAIESRGAGLLGQGGMSPWCVVKYIGEWNPIVAYKIASFTIKTNASKRKRKQGLISSEVVGTQRQRPSALRREQPGDSAPIPSRAQYLFPEGRGVDLQLLFSGFDRKDVETAERKALTVDALAFAARTLSGANGLAENPFSAYIHPSSLCLVSCDEPTIPLAIMPHDRMSVASTSSVSMYRAAYAAQSRAFWEPEHEKFFGGRRSVARGLAEESSRVLAASQTTGSIRVLAGDGCEHTRWLSVAALRRMRRWLLYVRDNIERTLARTPVQPFVARSENGLAEVIRRSHEVLPPSVFATAAVERLGLTTAPAVEAGPQWRASVHPKHLQRYL